MYRYLTINKLKGEVLKMRFLDRLAEFSILTKLAILLSLSFVLISSLALLIFLPTVSSSKIKPNFLPYQHFLPGTAGYIIENPNLQILYRHTTLRRPGRITKLCNRK